MLVNHFYPSPAILAGESEDEEEEFETEADEYTEKYVPRPTKRDRTRAVQPTRPKVDRSTSPQKKKKLAKTEVKSQSKEKKKAKKLAKKSPKSKAVVDSSEESDAEKEEAYKPRPSKKRSGATPAKASSAKKTPKSKAVAVDSSDEEEEQTEAYHPKPTKKHERASPAKKTPKKTADFSSDEEEVEAYVPRPTKKGRGTPAKAATTAEKGVKEGPPAKKGKVSVGKKIEEVKPSTPVKVDKGSAKSTKKR